MPFGLLYRIGYATVEAGYRDHVPSPMVRIPSYMIVYIDVYIKCIYVYWCSGKWYQNIYIPITVVLDRIKT